MSWLTSWFGDSFLNSSLLWFAFLIPLPIIIHLINQWRYQTKQWGAMMFLLKANQMARGYAKLRQWLILAARTLVLAGFVFAIARPISTLFTGWGGAQAEATVLLMDRSPSMHQMGDAGESKIATAKRQLTDTLQTLGSEQWITIDSATMEATSYDSVDALMDSPAVAEASSTTDIPGMLQATVDYVKNNQPGSAEVWLCSDLRSPDWNPDSANWPAIREAFTTMPQTVRFHLLAYPESTESNISIRVFDVRRQKDRDGNAVYMSMRLNRTDENETTRTIPVEIEINGARSTIEVELSGKQVELRDHRVALSGNQEKGWGRVAIPSDANESDNEFFFVFDDPPQRRIVLVAENEITTRALQIAAAVSPNGKSNSNVEFVTPDQLDSLVLDDAALLLWQTDLPDKETTGAVTAYVNNGGQVIFFPPDSLLGGIQRDKQFMGCRWTEWIQADADNKVMIENWRGDQDLLAATRSGAGLPVSQLEISGYATVNGELSQLATLTGGTPLLGRVPTDKGGVYFCSASTSDDRSTIAKNGIVLYVVVQRAISQGLSALGGTTDRIAGEIPEPTDSWRMVAGENETLSKEYGFQSGVYRIGDDNDAQWFAVNRSQREDQRDIIGDAQLEALFSGLKFNRVNDSAGSISGIVSEIWRYLLYVMIAAMLLEAILCIPRHAAARRAQNSLTSGFNRPQTGEAA